MNPKSHRLRRLQLAWVRVYGKFAGWHLCGGIVILVVALLEIVHGIIWLGCVLGGFGFALLASAIVCFQAARAMDEAEKGRKK